MKIIFTDLLSRIFTKRGKNMMRIWHNQHIESALSLFKERNLHVLVIGCNRGEENEIFFNNKVVNTDGIDTMEEIGKNFRKDSINYFPGSAENMFFIEDNSYDLVYSFATFEHILNIDKAYKEAIRVCKPGGYVYIFASPLWNSPYGHHNEGKLKSYPWIHLLYNRNELIRFAKDHNIAISKDEIDYIYKSKDFNRLSSTTYRASCQSIPYIEIVSNHLEHVGVEFEKQIDENILKKGYKMEDLLSVWHLFIAKKIK
jgi:SAM-dependent methyltransferase